MPAKNTLTAADSKMGKELSLMVESLALKPLLACTLTGPLRDLPTVGHLMGFLPFPGGLMLSLSKVQ
jgi:hypothetical protein